MTTQMRQRGACRDKELARTKSASAERTQIAEAPVPQMVEELVAPVPQLQAETVVVVQLPLPKRTSELWGPLIEGLYWRHDDKHLHELDSILLGYRVRSTRE